MKKLLIILLLLQGCSIHNPLPGLCYTDKTGTYLCPEEYPDEEPQKKTQLNCDTLGMIEYCYARQKLNQICHCVNHNDMENMTDFLWG